MDAWAKAFDKGKNAESADNIALTCVGLRISGSRDFAKRDRKIMEMQ